MKYIIIEDEAMAADLLHEMIAELRPQWTLENSMPTVAKSVEFLKSHDVDLIFMDIELADGSGFDIFNYVDIKTPVIFTTAYSEYAIKAFKQNSIDYLLKPIAQDELKGALNKFERMADSFLPHHLPMFRDFSAPASRRILIETSKGYNFINLDNILFFCNEDRYILAYTQDGHSAISSFNNMEEVMNKVAGMDFFQVSRAVVASIRSISKVEKDANARLKVTLSAGSSVRKVFVSSRRKAPFLEWLGK